MITTPVVGLRVRVPIVQMVVSKRTGIVLRAALPAATGVLHGRVTDSVWAVRCDDGTTRHVLLEHMEPEA